MVLGKEGDDRRRGPPSGKRAGYLPARLQWNQAAAIIQPRKRLLQLSGRFVTTLREEIDELAPFGPHRRGLFLVLRQHRRDHVVETQRLALT